jgi:hypothetical protein
MHEPNKKKKCRRRRKEKAPRTSSHDDTSRLLDVGANTTEDTPSSGGVSTSRLAALAILSF